MRFLPSGIDELMPNQAYELEMLRRNLLNVLKSHGYQQVFPPLIEFLDSLIAGAGKDLELSTFKITDLITGKLMGIRADMTPQVAKIDEQLSDKNAVTRLCYIGSTLKMRSDGFGGSRSPIQMGAELFGSSNITSDLEVILLMLHCLKIAQIKDPITLDLGHVAIFDSLVRYHALNADEYEQTFEAMSKKSAHLLPDTLEKKVRDDFIFLLTLTGSAEVLHRAKDRFQFIEAIDELIILTELLGAHEPNITVHIDLAELRGHKYYSGLLFGTFIANRGQAIALGGRYDKRNSHSGHSRPAVGFSCDLRGLLGLNSNRIMMPKVILAPALDTYDQELEDFIAELRQQGYGVLRDTQQPITNGMIEFELRKRNGAWTLIPY